MCKVSNDRSREIYKDCAKEYLPSAGSQLKGV